MARRSDHSRDELTELALGTAEDIIEREGVDALTARRLAKDIGYAPGTLYNLFTDQTEMILHLNQRTLTQLQSEVTALLKSQMDNSLATRLKALAMTYYRFANAHSQRWHLLFEYPLPQADALPEWYQDSVGALFDLLEQQLDDQGDTSADTALLARTLWAGVHGVTMLSHSGRLASDAATDPEAMIALLIDQMLGE